MAQGLTEVSKANVCIHCGKGDWCYRLGELSVCKRHAEPAEGWQLTSKQDAEGSYYYAPIDRFEKSIRPAQKRSWVYHSRDGQPLVRVCRKDDGMGCKPDRWQERSKGQRWLKGLRGIDRADIPVYRYSEVKAAIAAGQTIFIGEGEVCADALWEVGLPATTNIGGSGQWRSSDSADLAGAKVVLCPDRDQPGVKHMDAIAQDFPEAQWLYAFPHSGVWDNLPKSAGLDVADWIAIHHLSADDILASVGVKRTDQNASEETKELSFAQVCDLIDDIRTLPCPGEQKWHLAQLAKTCRLPISQIMDAYNSALVNQPPFQGVAVQDLLAKTPERFDWLVAALMPMATTAVLYAEAGTGKTLLVNSLVKAISSGQTWNEYPTKAGKVLYVQTDEPEINTAQNLKAAGFETVPNDNLTLYFQWQFDQMTQLREQITKTEPVLVVIDSLTSSNRSAAVEERSMEYARGLYELRDMAMEFGCAIIILHHENKNGGVRGTTAIKANVSEVWHLKRCDQLSSTHRLLEIEKSRSGCVGVRQLELDINDLSWQDQGEYDPSGNGKDRPATLSTGARLLAFLQERPGVKFEPDELVGEFGRSRDAVRKALSRLYKSGLIDCEFRLKTLAQGNAVRYKVYCFPELSSVTQTLAPSDVGTLDATLDALDPAQLTQQTVQRRKPSDSKDFSHNGQGSQFSPLDGVQRAEASDSKGSSHAEPTFSDQTGGVQRGVQRAEASDSKGSSHAGHSPPRYPQFSLPSDDRLISFVTNTPSDSTSDQQRSDPLPDPSDQREETQAISWVRYQGETWLVAAQQNDMLRLRQSGSPTVVHTVHVSQVGIGG